MLEHSKVSLRRLHHRDGPREATAGPGNRNRMVWKRRTVQRGSALERVGSFLPVDGQADVGVLQGTNGETLDWGFVS